MLHRFRAGCALLALWAALATCCAAQAVHGPMVAPGESSALLGEARRALIDLRMREAEATLRRLAARPDGEAAAYYHLTFASVMKAFLTDDHAYFEEFFGRSDTLRQILSAAPPNPWGDLLAAETHLNVALAYASTGRYVRAAWAARSAYFGFSRVLRKHPDFADAYKGMGILRLSIGSIPSTYQSLLKIFGFKGSILGGLEMLRRAGADGSYSKEEAVIYDAFARIALFGDHASAAAALGALYRSQPSSPLLGHVYGFSLVANRQAAEGEKLLRRASQMAAEPGRMHINFIDYYVADALFKQDMFAEAERVYREYLDRQKGPSLRAMANLRLGLAIEMQGRRAEALPHYRRVEDPRGFDSDGVARRRAGKLLEAPLSERERRVLLAANAYDSGRNGLASDLLEGVLEDQKTPRELRSEAAFRLARVRHSEGELNDALRYYRLAADLRTDPESKWGPWSQLHIGEIMAEQRSYERAAEAFDRALSYGGAFDYRQALEQRARAARERLAESR